MHRALAVVLVLAAHLGRRCSEGFAPNGAVLSAKSRPSQRGSRRAGLPTNTASTTETSTIERRKRTLLSRDRASSASSKRRVTGAIRRRARRLARVRRKNEARQQKRQQEQQQAAAATALEPDESWPAGSTNNDLAEQQRQHVLPSSDAEDRSPNEKGRPNASAPPSPSPSSSPPSPSPSSSRRAAKLAVATPQPPVATSESTAAEAAPSLLDDAIPTVQPPPASSPPSKMSKPAIKGRRIVKGEGRGLWRSIFGPRPLVEVHSVDDLSRFVDAEGWALEDLSVCTWGGDTGTWSLTDDATGVVQVGASAEPAVGGVGGEQAASVPHPAVQAVLERAVAGTKPSMHGDGRRIGLAIEGGGMRGCVAAGMASCLHFLGLADSFDGVYGASAGSLVGAYFVSRQANGTAVYHDVLPNAGAKFIDMAQFPQALGFNLPKVTNGGGRKGGELNGDEGAPRSGTSSDVETQSRFARVIGLDFLLEDVVGRIRPLDFPSFCANDRLQPLHVVTSGVNSMRSVSLASRRGHFSTLDQLTACIRASMLVPGLAGPLLAAPRGEPGDSTWREPAAAAANPSSSRLHPALSDGLTRRGILKGRGEGRASKFFVSRATSWAVGTWRRTQAIRVLGRGGNGTARIAEDVVAAAAAEASDEGAGESDLLVDAMVFEPLPYRSAIEDGCTDVVVLCTRPQGSQVLGKKPSIYETRVVKKYFEQHEDPGATSEISDHVQQLKHLRTYAEDALVLEAGSRTGLPQAAPIGGPGEGREAWLVAVAPDASCKEIGQLDMDRKTILQGCRDGFAACYDLFVGSAAAAVESPTEEEKSPDIGVQARSGAEMAREYFPDSYLSVTIDLNSTYVEPGRLLLDPPGSVESQGTEYAGSRGGIPFGNALAGNRAAIGRQLTGVGVPVGGTRGRLRRLFAPWKRRPLPRRAAAAAAAAATDNNDGRSYPVTNAIASAERAGAGEGLGSDEPGYTGTSTLGTLDGVGGEENAGEEE